MTRRLTLSLGLALVCQTFTAASAEPDIRVSTSPPWPELQARPAAVLLAHNAYQNGELTLARERYRQALTADPTNVDASNGLGSLALRERKPEEAMVWFRHSLSLSPHDALANARLADLGGSRDVHAVETHLRQLIARQGHETALHFALGNVYARQQRWREAQQAYFQAHTLDADDPDIAFNLAVSLDRLKQHARARDFYRLALAAAILRPAAFDPGLADQRLAALTQP